MTRIAIPLPVTFREIRLTRIGLPRFPFGATPGILFGAYARALETAILAPVARSAAKPAREPGQGEDGRDPNW